MCHFRAQIGPFFRNIFLVQTIVITFIYLFALFMVQNLKIFLQQMQSYDDAPFLDPKSSTCPKQMFFSGQFLSTYKPLLLCKMLKNFFPQSQSYENAQFFGQKWPISPNEFFSRNPVNESFLFNSCLPTCQKSKPDINLLVKF